MEAVNKNKCLQNEFQKLEVAAHKALGRNPLRTNHLIFPKCIHRVVVLLRLQQRLRIPAVKLSERKKTCEMQQDVSKKSIDELRESNEKLKKF